MGQTAVKIPEKIFFKIGEVCELVGVQAHVLRYWETEFSMLAPQKNRSGQRTYRRRDVEIALRIRELLYDEKFTIAGAKKRLAEEIRGGNRPRQQQPEAAPVSASTAAKASPSQKLSVENQFNLFGEEEFFVAEETHSNVAATSISNDLRNYSDDNSERKAAFMSLAKDLHEILQILNQDDNGKK
jgi:DNA-binding transcriptional MerR regulator